jgi:hypothetical protein
MSYGGKNVIEDEKKGKCEKSKKMEKKRRK